MAPASLLGLPTETLWIILQSLKDVHAAQYPDHDSSARAGRPRREILVERGEVAAFMTAKPEPTFITDIQALRLSCRRLCQVASPLLLPRLSLNLDQESLDLAAAVAAHPGIASGVRHVQVALNYCPSSLAQPPNSANGEDFNEIWYLARTEQLCALERRLGCDPDLHLPEVLEIDRVSDKGARLKYADAYYQIKTRWNCLRHVRQDGADKNEYAYGLGTPAVWKLVKRFRDVFVAAWEAFRRMHDEQYQLIATGAYASRLSSSMAKFRGLVSLHLVDKLEEQSLLGETTGESKFFDEMVQDAILAQKLVLPDPKSGDFEHLAQLLSAPMSWKFITHHLGCHSEQFPPARLLTQLPIALHGAGVQLQRLDINCFPGFTNDKPLYNNYISFANLGLEDNEDGSECKDDEQAVRNRARNLESLRKASQYLRAVSFTRFAGPKQDPEEERFPPTPAIYECINEFLCSLLSGQDLETVYVDLRRFKSTLGKPDTEDSDDLPSSTPAGREQSTLYWANDLLSKAMPNSRHRMRHLELRYMAVEKETLERLLRRLMTEDRHDNRHLRRIALHRIHLLVDQGTEHTAGALDRWGRIRNILKDVSLPEAFEHDFKYLHGGEETEESDDDETCPVLPLAMMEEVDEAMEEEVIERKRRLRITSREGWLPRWVVDKICSEGQVNWDPPSEDENTEPTPAVAQEGP